MILPTGLLQIENQILNNLKTILVYLWAPFANLLWYAHTVVMA